MIRTVCLSAVVVAIGVGSAGPANAAGQLPKAPYANCTEARDNNDCDIPASSDKYQDKLDRDQDGIGCEC